MRFLTLGIVLAAHTAALEEFGGSEGLRDMGLLESALHAPQASWGGAPLLDFPWEMAASYLVSLARNHAFIDGNKRTALTCALTFLDMNGYRCKNDRDTLVAITLAAATGGMNRARVAVALQQLHVSSG